MGRISQVFERTKRAGRIALMPYLAVGYPTVEMTVRLAPALERAGADIFELGVPYSDPLADGATIQRATQVALKNGVTPTICLEVAAEIGRAVEAPLLLMSYYNPISRYGADKFCRAAEQARVAGLIVPDLPPEEAEELQDAADKSGLALIYLVAPTSTDERLAIVAKVARGFLYCVALSGVTGARSQVSADLPAYLSRVRRATDLPLAVGFGISRPEHVHSVAQHADGAIIGAALVDRLAAFSPGDCVEGAAAYIRELATGTRRTP